MSDKTTQPNRYAQDPAFRARRQFLVYTRSRALTELARRHPEEYAQLLAKHREEAAEEAPADGRGGASDD